MKKTEFIAIAAMAAILPLGNANAIVAAQCGGWWSEGGGFVVGDYRLGNTCEYDLTYLQAMPPGKPVDLDFINVVPGTTYLFSTFNVGTVHNATLFGWDDYHFELGTGVKAGFVNFGGAAATPVFVPFGLNGTSAPLSDDFSSFALAPHSLAFFDGFVPNSPPQSAVNFRVAVTVPTNFTAASFTLRQYYSVPEPGVLALLGFGLVGLVGLVASRRRKQ